MTVRLTSDEADQRIKRIRSARGRDRSNFCALVERAGLDPSKDLRYGNFSGVDFAGCNLDGYDFTGTALYRCKFQGSRVSGATFSQCEFSTMETRYEPVEFPEDADDAEQAYRQSDASSAIGLPTNFDKHIARGTHFRDFAFAPLMHSVEAVQPDGRTIKLAVSSMNGEFNLRQTQWQDVSPTRGEKLEDYAAALNRVLGLGNYFGYKCVQPRSIVINTSEDCVIPRRGLGTIAIDQGLTFIDVTPVAAEVASVDTGRLVRRMRATACDLPAHCDDPV